MCITRILWKGAHACNPYTRLSSTCVQHGYSGKKHMCTDSTTRILGKEANVYSTDDLEKKLMYTARILGKEAHVYSTDT